MASPAEFNALWATWTLDQRLAFMYAFAPPGTWQPEGIVIDYIRENYGAAAAYVEHPEIGPLLRRAASEGWAAQRLDAAIEQTTFWKTTTDAQRQYDLLTKKDPASASKAVDQMVSTINTLLSNEGVEGQLSETRVRELATTLVRNGAGQDVIPKTVLAEVTYQTSPFQPVGRLGAQMSAVKQKADQYLIPVSDQSAFDWAKQIETGQAGPEAFDEYAKQIAKANYGWLADRIDAGATVRQLLDPQIQTLSQLWGQDPESLKVQDLAPVLEHYDGQQYRTMTLSETQKYARSDDRFWVDNVQGEAEAAKFVQGIAQQFGKAA